MLVVGIPLAWTLSFTSLSLNWLTRKRPKGKHKAKRGFGRRQVQDRRSRRGQSVSRLGRSRLSAPAGRTPRTSSLGSEAVHEPALRMVDRRASGPE